MTRDDSEAPSFYADPGMEKPGQGMHKMPMPARSGGKPPQSNSTTPPEFRNFRGDASDIAAGKAAGGFGAFDMDPNKAKMFEYLKLLGMK